jgi:hypothetical protein
MRFHFWEGCSHVGVQPGQIQQPQKLQQQVRKHLKQTRSTKKDMNGAGGWMGLEDGTGGDSLLFTVFLIFF